jgi:hypothetical protein
VIAMTNVLSDTPTFTEFVVPVTPYTRPPRAVHPPNRQIETFESFLMNADWRNNRLVATMHIGLAGDDVVHVAWFDFDTSGNQPVLTQSGIIDQEPEVHTYFSAIAVAASGDLGLTFMESSATEPVSMYITGQPAARYGSGTMLPPVPVAVGAGSYSGGRGGDFAGMSVDPEMGDVFWGANMYKAAGNASVWGTRIASFVVHRVLPPADALLGVLPDRRPPVFLEAPTARVGGSTELAPVDSTIAGASAQPFVIPDGARPPLPLTFDAAPDVLALQDRPLFGLMETWAWDWPSKPFSSPPESLRQPPS